MTYFIVTTGHGLTSRLIEATDTEHARTRFLLGRDLELEPDELEVHVASDAEICRVPSSASSRCARAGSAHVRRYAGT